MAMMMLSVESKGPLENSMTKADGTMEKFFDDLITCKKYFKKLPHRILVLNWVL